MRILESLENEKFLVQREEEEPVEVFYVEAEGQWAKVHLSNQAEKKIIQFLSEARDKRSKLAMSFSRAVVIVDGNGL